MSQSLAESLLATLRAYLNPLLLAAKNDQARTALFGALGQTARISSDPGLLQTLTSASKLGDQLSALDASKLDSWDGLQQLLTIGKQADALIQDLQQLAAEPDLAQVAENLAEEVAQLLLASWLRLEHEKVFSALAFLTIIRIRESSELKPGVVQNGVTLRTDYLVDEFQFDRLSDLVSKPGAVLLSWYLPNGMASPADAQLSADRLFPYLERMADAIGIAREKRTALVVAPPALTGPVSDDDGTLDARVGDDDDDFPPQPDFVPQPVFPVPDSYYAGYFPTLTFVPFNDGTTELTVAVRCSSLAHPGNTAGLIIEFSGSFNQTATFDDWRATFTAQGEIPALVFGPSKIQLFPTNSALTDGAAKFLLSYAPASGSSGPAFVFGSSTGSRLELGIPSVQMGITWTGASGVGALVGIGATACALVIMPGDGDGFLSSILPSNGLAAKFDFGITWSSGSGFAFNGGAGLDTTLPIGLSLGAVNIPSVHLGLTVDAGGLAVEISASLSTTIGPVQASIDRIGITTKLALPPGGGSPHFADASFSFKPPSGAGLSVDAAGVTGGGFLAYASGQYSGVLQLKFNDLALQAFGLITTQVAGSDGYSLIALIDANFPPVQLGWGFTLDGVGGLLAVHRTASVDNLRSAVKSGKVASILFPTSPISNASQILGTLDTLFPTAPGRFLFGPMALIGWGTPTVLTASVAVILELPEPIEIILLAKLIATLPNPSSALVKLNMDALGVLDLTQDDLSLDASLFDSKLISFTISGDMALRANWSSSPREFLLAIGGFHPQFTPPSNFPTLNRVSIDMPSGVVSKLRLAAYLALTSNSVQFGAALDVYIGVSGCGISGNLGFDALLQLSPFHFSADISGSVAVKVGGDDLASISLDATLSGPAPWHIAGKLKIHIIFFDVHISFSESWGLSAPSQQTSTVDVGALLNTALADPRSWSSQLPAGLSALVATRQIDDTSSVFAYPLALLEVHEQIVPLNLAITRFGESVPSGATEFSITAFNVGGQAAAYTAVQDDFAPAQFFDLSDSDKLSRPSFERHDAGAIMGGTLVTYGTSVAKTIDYESFFINTPGIVTVDEGLPQPFPWTALPVVMRTGAAGRKAINQAGKQRYAAPGNPIKITEPAFTLASTTTLAAITVSTVNGTTYSDVATALHKAIATSPAQRDMLQIVASHELTEVA